MKFDFKTRVQRVGFGSFKEAVCPAHIKKAGLFSYAGAEMEFYTAPSLLDAVTARVTAGLPAYTICDSDYQNAVKWWMDTQRHFLIQEDWIIPTYGTIFALASTIRMATVPGESIIVQPPVYNRYEQAAYRLGRNTLQNPLLYQDGEYSMDFNGLENLMARSDSKILVLCNPQNPTGNVWSEQVLEQVAQLAEKYNILVFSDEIFADVVFDGYCPSYLSIAGTHSHGIVSTSLGKAFNCTGINHANIFIANPDLAQRFIAQRDADHYGSMDAWSYSSVIGAYSPQGAAWKNAMVNYVAKNICYLNDFFTEYLPEVKAATCQGTYVLWQDWNGFEFNEKKLESFLINDALLHLSSGREYGSNRQCMTRMCVAVPLSYLECSMELLYNALRGRKIRRYS